MTALRLEAKLALSSSMVTLKPLCLSLNSYNLQNKPFQNRKIIPLSLPEPSGLFWHSKHTTNIRAPVDKPSSQCILEGVTQFALFVLVGCYAIALFPPEKTGTAIYDWVCHRQPNNNNSVCYFKTFYNKCLPSILFLSF